MMSPPTTDDQATANITSTEIMSLPNEVLDHIFKKVPLMTKLILGEVCVNLKQISTSHMDIYHKKVSIKERFWILDSVLNNEEHAIETDGLDMLEWLPDQSKPLTIKDYEDWDRELNGTLPPLPEDVFTSLKDTAFKDVTLKIQNVFRNSVQDIAYTLPPLKMQSLTKLTLDLNGSDLALRHLESMLQNCDSIECLIIEQTGQEGEDTHGVMMPFLDLQSRKLRLHEMYLKDLYYNSSVTVMVLTFTFSFTGVSWPLRI